MAFEEPRGTRLEEGAPPWIDGLGRGQVLGEQLLDEAAVQIVKLVGFQLPVLSIATAPAHASSAVGFTK
jgi:hypothetical protein